MHSLIRWVIAAAMSLAAATPVQAAWYQASSKHFVIYADSNPKQLQAFATRLEKFDQAVRAVMHYDDPPLGDGNRLTVFVLSNVGAVQKMAGGHPGNLAGFYVPRAEGCLAFVPKTAGSDWEGDMNADTVFFHEYTHHLQMQNIDKPYPVWLVEGFAEFMETAQFDRDGSVVLGGAPAFRAYGLLRGDPIRLPSLLTGDYQKLNDAQRDVFYGEGWLLTHYLYMGGGRSGQLSHYLDLLDSGTQPLDAAHQAFGDLDKLQHDLNAYKNQNSMLAMKIGADRAKAGAIDVKPLSAGGAAVILLRADLKLHGRDKTAAAPLEQQIRTIEASHPGDELVETTLSEAELDTGNIEAAEAAADRVLKTDPKSVEGLIFKGLATAQRGRTMQGADRHQAFENARNFFITANKIDTEDPEPLFDYYKTYLMEGVRPTENAISAMHYASDLVPQDIGLRMNSAIAYLLENNLKEARATLSPVAYSPHSGSAGEVARRMIAAIDAGDAKAALRSANNTPQSASAAK